MYRSPTYVLGASVLVISILTYGVFQPRDGDLHINYVKHTFTPKDEGATEAVHHNNAFHRYDGTGIIEIDCAMQIKDNGRSRSYF